MRRALWLRGLLCWLLVAGSGWAAEKPRNAGMMPVFADDEVEEKALQDQVDQGNALIEQTMRAMDGGDTRREQPAKTRTTQPPPSRAVTREKQETLNGGVEPIKDYLGNNVDDRNKQLNEIFADEKPAPPEPSDPPPPPSRAVTREKQETLNGGVEPIKDYLGNNVDDRNKQLNEIFADEKPAPPESPEPPPPPSRAVTREKQETLNGGVEPIKDYLGNNVDDRNKQLNEIFADEEPAPPEPPPSASPTPSSARIVVNAETSNHVSETTIDTSATFGKQFHALIIGIDDYKYINKLSNSANDAISIAELLEKNYGFTTVKLLNEKATRNNILRSLNEYRKKLSEDDSLLLYYAGHGEFNKETGSSYWLPVDAEDDDTTNWIDSKVISDQLKLISSRHILVIADSCFAGTMTRAAGSTLSSGITREKYLKKLFDKKSRVLIASGGNEPVLDDGATGHSLFSSILLESLSEPFAPVFTAEELMARHLKESVAGRTEQTPEYRVIRNSGHDGGDFIFARRN